jgi:hypothetical protein
MCSWFDGLTTNGFESVPYRERIVRLRAKRYGETSTKLVERSRAEKLP